MITIVYNTHILEHKKIIRETKRFIFLKSENDVHLFRVSKQGLKVKCIGKDYQFWTKTALRLDIE